MLAAAVIVVAVIWLIAVLVVFRRALLDFCKWCHTENPTRPATRGSGTPSPRMLNPRPSLESIERELAISNYIDPPKRR